MPRVGREGVGRGKKGLVTKTGRGHGTVSLVEAPLLVGMGGGMWRGERERETQRGKGRAGELIFLGCVNKMVGIRI